MPRPCRGIAYSAAALPLTGTRSLCLFLPKESRSWRARRAQLLPVAYRQRQLTPCTRNSPRDSDRFDRRHGREGIGTKLARELRPSLVPHASIMRMASRTTARPMRKCAASMLWEPSTTPPCAHIAKCGLRSCARCAADLGSRRSSLIARCNDSAADQLIFGQYLILRRIRLGRLVHADKSNTRDAKRIDAEIRNAGGEWLWRRDEAVIEKGALFTSFRV
jgi:hypothetical protein